MPNLLLCYNRKMPLFEIIFLALALSIDATIVSFSYGLCTTQNRRRCAFFLAAGTGFFQFLMPLFGSLLARVVYSYVESYANYIAGTIFIILGLKFLYDAFWKKEEEEKCNTRRISVRDIFFLSLATSIDALAAGASLYLLKVEILVPALIIGLVTFINSIAGFALGSFLKKLAPKPLEILGAVTLIIIGIKSFQI